MLTWDKIAPALILAAIGYLISDVSTIKTDVAVSKVKIEHVEEKVAGNYDMIKPMWQEFLADRSIDVNFTSANLQAN